MPLKSGRALAALAAQHAALRDMMDRCEALIGEVDAGRCGRTQLQREVTRLRLAFESHNVFEEELLRPLLYETDPYATARIERMVDDHVSEHRTMYRRLASKDTEELRDVIDTLRAHLEAEERYLLSPRVLRDQQVL